MLKPQKNKKIKGNMKGAVSLKKITTYIAEKDYQFIKSMDSSSQAKHYRTAIATYVRKASKKRRQSQ
ncbi:hypothetical protein ACVWZB_004772 [Paenibacillus polymyxa]